MAQGTLSVESANILPIIKKWLYSDKDVFLRELVSNSCDAMEKLKILRDQSKCDVKDEEFRIDIKIDKENKTLTISDTGIGMTKEEVEKYISQIAFSGAKEFMEKYETKEQIIGHFGLGFYSAYMVSKNVEIDTLSFKEDATPVLWACDGSSDYDISSGTRKERGTTITLHIDDDSIDYLENNKLDTILSKYCSFLPYPIYLDDKEINNSDPLYLKNPSDCTEKDYLDFYKKLYPMDPEPLFWIHLNVDYPFHLKGILYFPKIHKRYDVNQSTIKLFCNRVYVSDNCKDLFPEYLLILKGAIDSPDIPLNVSRSYLQMDSTVRKLSSHIDKKITDRLSTLYKTDREKFISCWEDIEMVIKMGILQNEKFYDRAKDFLIWKNIEGNWTTLNEYLERAKNKKIFYTPKGQDNSSFVNLYTEKGIEILTTNSLIDNPLMSFLESKMTPTTFQRIDGALDESILDASKEKTLIDEEGKTEASHIASCVKSSLSIPDLEVEAKSLASDSLPGFIVIDEQSRRLNEYMSMHQNDSMAFPSKKTFIVNTNSPLISAMVSIHKKDPDLAKEAIEQIYDLASLSQKEMDPKQISSYVSKSYELLTKLIAKI